MTRFDLMGSIASLMICVTPSSFSASASQSQSFRHVEARCRGVKIPFISLPCTPLVTHSHSRKYKAEGNCELTCIARCQRCLIFIVGIHCVLESRLLVRNCEN